jgi:hypothetical protein
MVEEWHWKFIPKISDSKLSKSNVDLYVTSEAFVVSKVNKIFSGFQMCQMVKITNISGTISVSIIRV